MPNSLSEYAIGVINAPQKRKGIHTPFAISDITIAAKNTATAIKIIFFIILDLFHLAHNSSKYLDIQAPNLLLHTRN